MGTGDQDRAGTSAVLHFLRHFLTERAFPFAQAAKHFFISTRMRPVWHQGGQRGTACGIWVLVAGDMDAARTGIANLLEQFPSATPLRFPNQLEMRNFQMHATFLGNAQHFIDRLENVNALAAHMYGENRIVLFYDLCQFHQLVRCTISAWRIDQAQAHTHCTGTKFTGKKRLHLLQLLCSRRTVNKAHDREPQRTMSDQHSNIERCPAVPDSADICGHGRHCDLFPVERHFQLRGKILLYRRFAAGF